MPRMMAKCELAFAREVDQAVDLARAAERAHLKGIDGSYRPLHHTRIEYLYELAYLRIFISWEVFLEASFLRYLCGLHSHRHGAQVMAGGQPYHKTIDDAENAMLGNWHYFLWANTDKVLAMVKKHLDKGRHQTIIAAARGRLDNYAAIRHRVAHGQSDAILKFDNAAMALAGRRNFGSKAGRFLRAFNTSVSPPLRWIESIARVLKSLASAIA